MSRRNRTKHAETRPGSSGGRADFLATASRWTFYAGLVLGASLFFPDYFFDGFEVPKLFAVEVAAILTFGLWFATLYFQPRPQLRLPVVSLPLVALFLVAALSVAWSRDPRLAVERLLQVSSLAVFGLFAWGLFRDRNIRRPLYFIIFAAGAMAAWGLALDWVKPLRLAIYPNFLIKYSDTNVVDLYRELTSNQGNPNFLMHVLVLAAPLNLGAILAELTYAGGRITRRLGLVALLGLSLLAELICFLRSQNRSSLIGFVAALLLMAVLLLIFRRAAILSYLGRRWRSLSLLFVAGILALAGFTRLTAEGRSLYQRAETGSRARIEHWKTRFASLSNPENIDVYSRVVFLETGRAMIGDDPLLGKGIGQFPLEYPLYKTAKHWSAFGLQTEPPIKRWSLIPPETHNEYLQVAVELGLPALGLFLIFWGLLAVALGGCLRRKRSEAGFYLLLGASAGLAGSLINALFTFPLQTVTSGTFIWTTAGLGLAACGGCGEGRLFRVLVRPLPLGRRAVRYGAAVVTAVILMLGIRMAWDSLRGQYLFMDALKNHAHDIKYSIQRNRQAARLLPGHYEIIFVQGWLNQLAGDTTSARQWYERTLEVNPNFPEIYEHLIRLEYLNQGYDQARALIRRFYSVYAGVPPSETLLIEGLLGLKEGTPGGMQLASERLRRVGGLDPLMTLAQAFQQQGRLDSCLDVMDTVIKTGAMGELPDIRAQVRFYDARMALAAGDSARAANDLSEVVRQQGQSNNDLIDRSSKMLEALNAHKK